VWGGTFHPVHPRAFSYDDGAAVTLPREAHMMLMPVTRHRMAATTTSQKPGRNDASPMMLSLPSCSDTCQ
jgi:hypothetical protein